MISFDNPLTQKPHVRDYSPCKPLLTYNLLISKRIHSSTVLFKNVYNVFLFCFARNSTYLSISTVLLFTGILKPTASLFGDQHYVKRCLCKSILQGFESVYLYIFSHASILMVQLKHLLLIVHFPLELPLSAS